MASYVVSELKFKAPQPEVSQYTQTATLLGPMHKGWSAVANEDTRVLALKVRKVGPDGKVITKPYRFPFEALHWMVYTAAKVPDQSEPLDPK